MLLGAAGIARQQWRARIETKGFRAMIAAHIASPASNGGRGLKLGELADGGAHLGHRPPAMAGAD